MPVRRSGHVYTPYRPQNPISDRMQNLSHEKKNNHQVLCVIYIHVFFFFLLPQVMVYDPSEFNITTLQGHNLTTDYILWKKHKPHKNRPNQGLYTGE